MEYIEDKDNPGNILKVSTVTEPIDVDNLILQIKLANDQIISSTISRDKMQEELDAIYTQVPSMKPLLDQVGNNLSANDVTL